MKSIKKPRKAQVYYSASLMNSIIAKVANGSSLSEAIKSPDMPDRTVFYSWLKRYPHHGEEYNEAVKRKLECMFDELLNEPPPTQEELEHPIFYSKMRDRRQKKA